MNKQKPIKQHQEKASHEYQIKQSKVSVQAKLVVGYWELIPMESWAGLLALQDTYTVRVAEEISATKKHRMFWWTDKMIPDLCVTTVLLAQDD